MGLPGDAELEGLIQGGEGPRVEFKASFDARPSYGPSLGDLNLDRFEKTYLPRAVSPSVLAENRRSAEHKLATAGFIEPTPEGTPTPAGILVLCEMPARCLAGA